MSFGHATQPSPYPLDLCVADSNSWIEINEWNNLIWLNLYLHSSVKIQATKNSRKM